MTEALYRAVVAAGQAPSAHNTQPWRWHLTGAVLDLFADPDRMAGVPDPAGHLTAVSCGAALHHARLSLAAQGWHVTVDRRPASTCSRHLARLHIDGAAPVSSGTARLARAIRQRHTDLRPVTGWPIEPQELRIVVRAFASHDIRVHILRPDQILVLTVVAAHSSAPGFAEQQWHDQMALWAGADRIAGAGDDLRLPVQQGEHDRAATFVLLHGPGDHPADWLSAGEALSAGWLVATQYGMSVMPFSAPIEQGRCQANLRHVVSDLDHPYLMMRLGRHKSPALAPPTPRLSVEQIIERVQAR
ncbi:nitroreductase [Actinoplanes hulinensis]|uniref:Nitroreductase n=1 Tax=Actinoplanes hulinensis TaxID=1144547 RepID=A0ABS7B5S7_9ACTN|nr:nitroreductase [Actinoplanes hulinensis]MBW6436361.1 nitroreductase [Actinoplanes hulinensis]